MPGDEYGWAVPDPEGGDHAAGMDAGSEDDSLEKLSPPHFQTRSRSVDSVSLSSDRDSGAAICVLPELPWIGFLAKRWLLRSWQSLVAAALYALSDWVSVLAASWGPYAWRTAALVGPWAESIPAHEAPPIVKLAPPAPNLCLAALLVLALPCMLLYHQLSLNRAGSYYDTFSEMFTQLPLHFRNVVRRCGEGYAASIETEHQQVIFRTVNGLEFGIVFVAVAVVSFAVVPHAGAAVTNAAAAGPVHHLHPLLAKAAVVFVLHRVWGANVFEGDCMGLFQPEGMWNFRWTFSNGGMDEDNEGTLHSALKPLSRRPEQWRSPSSRLG